PKDFPLFRNFLLASARHDHGAGGAGERGTDAIYGGHSHVGTMIYLGDNWPDEFRGHLFTHNLGGHQINQEVNQCEGSGFNTVHAGRDLFFCSDPKYVALDLQYGPDGAVYVIDWYDQQHCHNPNSERWDRSNGRIYRLEYAATYKPLKVDLAAMSDEKLIELHGHRNEWFVRTARRLLHERAQAGTLRQEVIPMLGGIFANHLDPAIRLRALWTIHAVGHFSDEVARRALADPDEFVRGWGIQLATDDREVSAELLNEFSRLAKTDASSVVRLYLASAIPRVTEASAWELIDALARHGEDRDDRNLPLLLWYGLAHWMPNNLDRAFAVAEHTQIPQLEDYIYWYAATFDGDALKRAVTALAKAEGETLRRRLAGLWLAMEPRANVAMPDVWKQVAPKLYASKDPRVQRQAERVAAVFGDDSMFSRLRESLANSTADADTRQHAFAVLSRAQDRPSLPVFLRLLDDAAFRSPAINLLARFDAPEISEALLSRFEKFTPAERSAALNTLTSRAKFAMPLLDAVAAGRFKQLTAFHVRQLLELKNAEVDERVTATWGKILKSTAEKQTQVARLEKVFNEAPLWAYDAGAGRQHFQKICSTCHVLHGEGTRVGPELTGAGKNGIRYFLENIIDPNAVIGADFQMTTVETKKGDTISGLVVSETPSALTIRTVTDQVIIAKTDLAERRMNETSLMPEGLLESLNDREQIELLLFLTSN
ncbi:MAG TPA: hypothetical protein VFA77_16700, partial [Candidatus Eisenbacteria bacterium]|nr:hypothetical protein [Candidatus Eisenbacteria bacterium]